MKIVLVDIDGTISKVGDRLKYLLQSPKDWDSFYEACFDDEPIQPVVDLVHFLANRYKVVYCTGRRESVRDRTLSWFIKHSLPTGNVLMRPNGDHRHDTEIKPELLKEAGISLSDIAYVIEDRNSMVKKWRELGLTVLQPAEGDF